MWNCAKECGYWDGDGCTINYTPEAFLLLCPCYDLAITHARDPTPLTLSRSGVNDQSQRAAQKSAVKDRSQIPVFRDSEDLSGADRPGANPCFSGKEQTT